MTSDGEAPVAIMIASYEVVLVYYILIVFWIIRVLMTRIELRLPVFFILIFMALIPMLFSVFVLLKNFY